MPQKKRICGRGNISIAKIRCLFSLGDHHLFIQGYSKLTTRILASNKYFDLCWRRMCITCRTCEWKDCLKNNQIPQCNVIALWPGMAEGSKSKRKNNQIIEIRIVYSRQETISLFSTYFSSSLFILLSITLVAQSCFKELT